MASPEEVAATATAAAAYSSTDGGECQYAAATTTTTKTMTSFTKRKRTKRGLRSFSSPPLPAPAPDEEKEEEYFSTSTTTEEEEDMAHCLILLAQGHTAAASSSPVVADSGLQSTGDTIIRKFGGTTTAMGDALYVYECKTCNKCFPSFQALGGHRTSHKKPKLLQPPLPAVKDDVVDMDREHGGLDITMNSSSSFARVKPALSTAPPPPAPAPANKLNRVHECSICGSEFASGQALGGHMRRHRPVLGGATATATSAAPDSPEAPNSSSSSNGGGSKKEEKKKCMLLSLDLNLPAPSEEINGAANSMADAFAFVDHRPLALVDCHY